jgi:hypothetical protein
LKGKNCFTLINCLDLVLSEIEDKAIAFIHLVAEFGDRYWTKIVAQSFEFGCTHIPKSKIFASNYQNITKKREYNKNYLFLIQ